MAIQERGNPGHGLFQRGARGRLQVGCGQLLPAVRLVGVDIARIDAAIGVAARLRPQAVQGEVGGVIAGVGLGPALDLVRQALA